MADRHNILVEEASGENSMVQEQAVDGVDYG